MYRTARFGLFFALFRFAVSFLRRPEASRTWEAMVVSSSTAEN